MDSQGRVIVAGKQTMLRYTPSGQIDSSFADNGVLIMPPSVIDSGEQFFFDFGPLAIDTQHRVVSASDRFIVRIDETGLPDRELSDDGVQRLELYSTDGQSEGRINDILIDPTGQLIVGGTNTPVAFFGWYVIA